MSQRSFFGDALNPAPSDSRRPYGAAAFFMQPTQDCVRCGELVLG